MPQGYIKEATYQFSDLYLSGKSSNSWGRGGQTKRDTLTVKQTECSFIYIDELYAFNTVFLLSAFVVKAANPVDVDDPAPIVVKAPSQSDGPAPLVITAPGGPVDADDPAPIVLEATSPGDANDRPAPIVVKAPTLGDADRPAPIVVKAHSPGDANDPASTVEKVPSPGDFDDPAPYSKLYININQMTYYS